MEEPPHECPCRDDHAPSQEADSDVRFSTCNPISLDDQVGDVGLFEGEVGEVLQDSLRPVLVSLLVTLGTGCTNARTFGGIEHPELDTCCIGVEPHEPTECIYLPDHVSLG